GWAYTWSSTGSVNTAPNCRTLTLLVVNAVSLAFQPDRVLSLCCVSTATDWGFGGPVFVRVSLQVTSSRRRSGRGSVRFAMSHPQQVESIDARGMSAVTRPSEGCAGGRSELTPYPNGQQACPPAFSDIDRQTTSNEVAPYHLERTMRDVGLARAIILQDGRPAGRITLTGWLRRRTGHGVASDTRPCGSRFGA